MCVLQTTYIWTHHHARARAHTHTHTHTVQVHAHEHIARVIWRCRAPCGGAEGSTHVCMHIDMYVCMHVAEHLAVEIEGQYVAVLGRQLRRHHRELGCDFLVGIQTDDHTVARCKGHKVIGPVNVPRIEDLVRSVLDRVGRGDVHLVHPVQDIHNVVFAKDILVHIHDGIALRDASKRLLLRLIQDPLRRCVRRRCKIPPVRRRRGRGPLGNGPCTDRGEVPEVLLVAQAHDADLWIHRSCYENA